MVPDSRLHWRTLCKQRQKPWNRQSQSISPQEMDDVKQRQTTDVIFVCYYIGAELFFFRDMLSLLRSNEQLVCWIKFSVLNHISWLIR